MMTPPIALTGLVLLTPLLEEMGAFYVEQFGLSELARGPDEISLGGSGTTIPPLVIRRAPKASLGGLSFAFRDAGRIDAAHRAIADAGLAPSPVSNDRFTVLDSDGTQVILHVGDDVSVGKLPMPTDRPLFLSHVVLNSSDPERLVGFYRDVLGLRISDRYERGLLVFMRCDQPQHHCLGISPGAGNGLNHFAMECGNIDAVMRGTSRMRRTGAREVWGPGRHGPGGNVFCYFEDPTGFVPEYTCDVLQIEDDAAWQPREWQRTPENGNVWLSGGPSERAAALMSGTAFPNPIARSGLVTTE